MNPVSSAAQNIGVKMAFLEKSGTRQRMTISFLREISFAFHVTY
jgi:hypothetical protein